MLYMLGKLMKIDGCVLNILSYTKKDNYPLPQIDELVDATSDHKLLTFIDAFSGIIIYV